MRLIHIRPNVKAFWDSENQQAMEQAKEADSKSEAIGLYWILCYTCQYFEISLCPIRCWCIARIFKYVSWALLAIDALEDILPMSNQSRNDCLLCKVKPCLKMKALL